MYNLERRFYFKLQPSLNGLAEEGIIISIKHVDRK